ncbi:hypothetical protein IAR55_004010 [Kwoniella newhampshirensis]|uniref:Peptidase A1 domain-containing protein n=1 Tax=Kwoniella newhampshirensis TaxID=1651941 RepID=A0AAW0YLG9_9TREE
MAMTLCGLTITYLTITSTLLSLTHAATTLKLNRHITGSSAIQRKINALAKRDDLPLDTASSRGVSYTVDVRIGNDGSSIPVIVDTGSDQFWVASTACGICSAGGMTSSVLEAPQGCTRHSIQYGLGEVSGCVDHTSLMVGEYTVDGLHVLGVTDVDEHILSDGQYMSGIWGICRNGATVDGSPTAVSLMYTQGLIKSPTVGFYLGRDGDGTDSEMTIGDVSALPYTNTDKKVTLPSHDNPNHLNEVTIDSITINGKDLGEKIVAVIDTRSTGISTPEPLIGEVYSALFDGVAYKYANDYVIPLDFPMEARDIVGQPIEDNYGWCYGLFVPLFHGTEFMVIGDAFLHNVYHTVNVDRGDVTFYALS